MPFTHESRIDVKKLISIHAEVADYELSRICFLHKRVPRPCFTVITFPI